MARMKRTRTNDEIAAGAAARRQALRMGGLAFGIGAILLALTGEFFSLHCVLLIAAAIAGGLAGARAARRHDQTPSSVKSGASVGGICTALGFGLPFIAYFLHRWATLTDADVARRLAQLTPAELAQIEASGIKVGREYLIGQDIAYVFAYLLAALILGWLFGLLGGALGQRSG